MNGAIFSKGPEMLTAANDPIMSNSFNKNVTTKYAAPALRTGATKLIGIGNCHNISAPIKRTVKINNIPIVELRNVTISSKAELPTTFEIMFANPNNIKKTKNPISFDSTILNIDLIIINWDHLYLSFLGVTVTFLNTNTHFSRKEVQTMKTLSLIVLLIFLAGCGGYVVEIPTDEVEPANDWKDVELTDINTGNTFKVSDFKGKTVLLESFAVWCPTCLRQQKEMKKLPDLVHISLDTDPNEDEAKVKSHIERNDLDWYFAISPETMTQALIDEYGLGIVNAPSAPVILICEDQSTRFLKSGVKSAEELQKEVEVGC